MTIHIDEDLLSPANVADPYPALAAMLAEGPVRWNESQGSWMVLGYSAFQAALRDRRLSSDRIRPVINLRLSDEERAQRAPTFDVLEHWMVFNDPPNHTRLRSLVSGAFTPKAIGALRPRVEMIVNDQLDFLREREVVDLVHDFAFPIPAVVIAEFLGVPASDRELFKEWSDSIMSLVFGGPSTGDRVDRGQRGIIEMGGYLRERVRAARTDSPDDMIGFLAGARASDDSLTEDEIVSTCILLLFAGHETTTSLIGNGVKALLDHPAELASLREDPDRAQKAIEEILRFDGPSKLEVRRVAETMELGGHKFIDGDRVLLVQASANRDPAAFENPDTFDIRRDPNRHVGFGFGLHHCLGAALARLEGAIAIPALMDRFPEMAATGTVPTWHEVIVSRGMATFEVELGKS